MLSKLVTSPLAAYKDPNRPLEERVSDLLSRLTFREKCLLSAGEKDNSPPPIPRLEIPQFRMCDGPHGVSPGAVRNSPHYAEATGLESSTYFPTGIQLASTFDPALAERFGAALAEEARAAGCSMVLGPAINLCRSPMNGRTFEYYTEDPFLNSRIAVAVVRGIQSRRVAACVKHFVANNQESNRFKVNVVVSRRALEELYFPAFRACVEEADAWGFMSAYNKVNGTHVSEHRELLRETLKERWGFSGVVVSDWGATRRCSGVVKLVSAGLDVEMGHRVLYQPDEMEALRAAGKFPEKEFEDNVRRIVRAHVRTGAFDPPEMVPRGSINTEEHQALARRVAEEGTVLLKNEGDLLPFDLDRLDSLALLGKHADLRFGRKKLGGGSSAVFPPYEVTIRQGLEEKLAGKVELVDDPASADAAVVCVGLEHTHDFKGGDHEGSDKLRYSLGFLQPRLVRRVAKANPNTVVVLVNGSPFGVEGFVDHVPAVVEAWYGGMEIGRVVADVLFGDVNPSGKLPVTWPKRKRDIPTALSFVRTVLPFPEVRYEEGVFVGYRYYDAFGPEPRFPFGHGLSYSKFEFAGVRVDRERLAADLDSRLEVTVTLRNVGGRHGAEVVQLYVHPVDPRVERPVKELRGFRRLELSPGESTDATFELTPRDLARFDEARGRWVVDEGPYEVWAGSSSAHLPLRAAFECAR
ncbi:MAG: glycoside hydrolase family 3 C-terminal domain-containing protein [Promethearchaeota archaeon]